MKKSIFLFFAAILCAIGVQAADTYYFRGGHNSWGGSSKMTTSTDGHYVYYHINDISMNQGKEFKINKNNADSWDQSYYDIVNNYNGTDLKITASDNRSISAAGYVILYLPNTLVNPSNKAILCASTKLTDGIEQVFLKHPWNGGGWEYCNALTKNSSGKLVITKKYGSAGCNWSMKKEAWYEKWVATPTLVNEPQTGDDCEFAFDPADQTITITKQLTKNIGSITITMACDQHPNIYYYGGVDGSVTYPEWPGVNMIDNGDGTYSYKVDNVNLDLGLDYVITLKEVNENEWKSEDLNAKADVSHDVSIFNFPKIVVLGIDGKWDETNALTDVSNDYLTVSKTITFAAAGTHNLKCHVGDAQYQGGSVVNITRANPSSNKFDADHGGDGKFTADIAGNYIFTWTYKTKTLTVTYPDMPKYTVAAQANDVNMGSVSGAGEFNQGETATLTATPKDGYVFVNWTKNDVEVSTAVEYSFEVTEDVSLVANFEAAVEETHNVTVSYLFGSTPVKETLVVAVGVSTGVEITAPAKIDGRYAFQSWTLGSGVTSTDATVNPINVTTLASGDYSLTANYEDTYTTIYFVNTKSWPAVNAYVWGTGDPYKPWSGEAMTLTGDKAHGYDVYSYSFPAEYTNCIFNGNGQTDDLIVKAGQYYDIASKTWYATLAEVPSPAPVVMETVYLINTGNWEKVHAHAWKDAVNNGWPGDQLTKSGEKIAEFDVYPFQAEQGQWTNIIFNCGGDECKTDDLTWQAGKYYAHSTGEWYDTPEAAEEALAGPATIVLHGNFVNPSWEDTEKLTISDDQKTATITVLIEKGSYEFGVKQNGEWVANGKAFTKDNNEHEIVAGEGNLTLVADITGNYTFTWTYETNTLTITYPTEEVVIEKHYYVRGSHTNWEVDEDYELTLTDGVYKKEVTLAKDVEFKINDGADAWWGKGNLGGKSYNELDVMDNGNLKMKEAKTFTIIFKPAEHLITFEDLTPVEVKCYLMGNGNANGVEMTPNPNNNNEYMLLDHYISAPFNFKYGEEVSDQVDNYDFPGIAWADGNITLPKGYYDFYFKKDIKKVYIANATDTYTRDVTNTYGTICLPYTSVSTSGATFYEVYGKEVGKVYLVSVTQLDAGMPYIFEATASPSQIKVVYNKNTEVATADVNNGLQGTFEDETEVEAGYYILYNNEFRKSDGEAKVNAYRAYLDFDAIVGGKPGQPMPGRRYIGMSVQGENEATGVEDLFTTDAPVKVIENGQLIIIREGVKYNVQGQKL